MSPTARSPRTSPAPIAAAVPALAVAADAFATGPHAAGDDAGDGLSEAAIAALVAQTEPRERIIAELELGRLAVTGFASLDRPEAMFQ